MEKGDFYISTMTSSNIAVVLTIGVITILVVRIIYVIYRSSKSLHSKSPRSLSTLIVLGSGGHTAEMLNLLYVLQIEKFKPRYYVAAATDNMSLQKARVFEDSLLGKEALEEVGGAEFMQIYRSREVGQSYVTSVGTTLVAIAHALWLMIKIRPQVVSDKPLILPFAPLRGSALKLKLSIFRYFFLFISWYSDLSIFGTPSQILCNGPGTCIPLCVIAFLFKVLGIRWSSIFYVESIARVRKLSLSGLLLYKLHMADQLFVQWLQLKDKYPRAHYVGCLM